MDVLMRLIPRARPLVDAAIAQGSPIIVQGYQGPTGKTTLVNDLREHGALAWEWWEANQKSDDNSCAIVITLDKPISL